MVDAGFPPLQAAAAASWFGGNALLFGILWLLKSYCSMGLLMSFVICFAARSLARRLITATAMKIFRGKRVGTIYGSIRREF